MPVVTDTPVHVTTRGKEFAFAVLSAAGTESAITQLTEDPSGLSATRKLTVQSDLAMKGNHKLIERYT